MNRIETDNYHIASYFNELGKLINEFTREDIINGNRSNSAAYARFLFVYISINPPEPFIKATYRQISEFLILSDSNVRQYILYYVPKPHYLKDVRILKRRLFTVISKKIPIEVLNNILSTNNVTIECLIDNVIDTSQMNRKAVEQFADYLKDYCLTRYIDD